MGGCSDGRRKPSSLSRYLNTLRQVLDFAGVEPNPARDRRVKLPRIEATTVEPPTAKQVDAIIAQSPPRWKLALRTLEQTGMRVGELRDLEWRCGPRREPLPDPSGKDSHRTALGFSP
jgi:integrase